VSVDVLVVGAGPTGLLLAGELARHGLRPRLVDKLAAPSSKSKALGVHARTLEIWEDLGIVDEALARGRKLYGMNLYAGADRLAHLSLDELDSPYPFVLVLPQFETEAILTQHAAALDVPVERGVTLVGIAPDSDAVRCTLAHPDGRVEETRVPWLVGADGAHSDVRRLLDVPYRGSDLAASFVFGDVGIDWWVARDEGHVFFSPDGPVLCLPLPGEGRWRVIAGLPPGQPRPQEVTLELLRDLVRERIAFPLDLHDPEWLTGFDVRQRKVETYRVGRVFLAGDAAHCHSPVGGQGMNTGLQDAYNLAWRLALVQRGSGQPGLLDAYQAEREPVARALLWGTDRGTRVVTLRNPVGQAVRNHVASYLTSLDVVRQRLARSVGELSVHYRGSPLVDEDRTSLLDAELLRDAHNELPSVLDWREFSSAPHPGDRAPDVAFPTPGGDARLYPLLQGTSHVVLVFDGAAATESGYSGMQALAERVRARHAAHVTVLLVVPASEAPLALSGSPGLVLDSEGLLHQAYGAGAECLYVIRPDGYVGYRCQPADADRLMAYLGRILV
jgi:2-polyprenyl-6-methoxyphenol hydroxylase-like FAD-dependent oxidoreductase